MFFILLCWQPKSMWSAHCQCAQWQMGQFALGGKPYRKTCFWIRLYQWGPPHNITPFVELEVTIVPESICSWLIDQRSEVLPVVVVPCVCVGTPQSVWFAHFWFQLGLYIRECTKPKRTCPSSSAGLLIGVFISREPVEVCVCITVWSWRLEVHIMTKVVKGRVIGNCACALFSSNAAMGFD